jgi:hypothetical protein
MELDRERGVEEEKLGLKVIDGSTRGLHKIIKEFF